MTRCRECGKSWGGLRAEHCTSCHETFSSTAAGDRHRRGEFPDRYCTTVGLEFNERRGVWKLPGAWFPADAVREERPHGSGVGVSEGAEILSPEIDDLETRA